MKKTQTDRSCFHVLFLIYLGAYAWIATNVILNTLDVKTSYGALGIDQF